MVWLAVFFGGGAGSLLRYGLYLGVARLAVGPTLLGTLAANVIGSFLLGLLARVGLSARLSEPTRLALTTGLCGGFTTYSTFNLEALALLSDGHLFKGGGYLFATVFLCALSGAAGMWLGGRIN